MNEELSTLAFICFTGAGFSASVIILLYKWGIIEWYTTLRATNKYVAMLPEACIFCGTFWINVAWLVCLVSFGVIDMYPVYIVAPFAGAAFATKLTT